RGERLGPRVPPRGARTTRPSWARRGARGLRSRDPRVALPLRARAMTDYARALELATQVAREAGEIFRRDFFREGGPPGENGKSPVDVEAERLIRARIHAAFPAHGLRAEELPEEDRAPAEGETHYWLVDPNDGTRGYLSGFREATVSIALI